MTMEHCDFREDGNILKHYKSIASNKGYDKFSEYIRLALREGYKRVKPNPKLEVMNGTGKESAN